MTAAQSIKYAILGPTIYGKLSVAKLAESTPKIPETIAVEKNTLSLNFATSLLLPYIDSQTLSSRVDTDLTHAANSRSAIPNTGVEERPTKRRKLNIEEVLSMTPCVPQQYDVLMGSGDKSNKHIGNNLLLLEKLAYQDAYQQTNNSGIKQSIAEAVSSYIMDRGRFLTMTDDGYYVELKPRCETVINSLKQKLREDFEPGQKEKKMANVMAKLEGYFKANESSQTG